MPADSGFVLSLSDLRNRLAEMGGTLADLDDTLAIAEGRKRLEELEKAVSSPGFWNDAEKAKDVIRRLKEQKTQVEPFEDLRRRHHETADLMDLVDESDTAAMEEISGEIYRMERDLGRLEVRSMLRGEHDASDAFVSIHAGAGGTESCDWAHMLARMYSRWCERSGYQVTVTDTLPGEEAGYRSVTCHVQGPCAYGYLQSEIGVHRLVRISPFDFRKRRHTSFASVDVVPDRDDTVSVEINKSDLRIDTFRSKGAGGQHVNVTDSAVRITHIPTGIVVQCQNERSQHANRATAMKMLRARLLRHEEKKRDAELAKLYGEKGEIAWGNQIRSYVMQPYTMVKDHRTKFETSNVEAVLDGDLADVMEAYLRHKCRQARK